MSKFYISDIDLQVNGGRVSDADKALKNVANYVTQHIDLTFSFKEFKNWYHSDTDKPFRWGSNSYHWSRN